MEAFQPYVHADFSQKSVLHAAADMFRDESYNEGFKAPTPGALATSLDPKVVQRAPLRLMDEVFASLLDGSCDRAIITSPPRIGKSNRVSIWGAFWWLTHHKDHNIIVASYSADLAVRNGKAVRRLVERYGHRFGLTLEEGSTSAKDWTLTSGGGLRAVGMEGGITGFDGDCIVIDDALRGRKDADSPIIRDQVWNSFTSGLMTRLSPGAPVLVTMTRWHEDDIVGRVLKEDGDVKEGGQWKTLVMPALATAEDDPLGRAIGEPLEHPLIDPDDTESLKEYWLDRKTRVGVRDWGSLFLCDPKPPEGALIKKDQIHRAPLADMPPASIKSVCVDPSGGGRDEAGIIAGFLSDSKVVLTHDRSGRMSSELWPREACLLAHETGAHRIVFEEVGDKDRLLIAGAWKQLHAEGKVGALMPKLVGAKHRGESKVARAEPVAQAMINQQVLLGADLPDVIEEWVSWMPNDRFSPGRIDAVTYLARDLLPDPGQAPMEVGAPPTEQLQGWRNTSPVGKWGATKVGRRNGGGGGGNVVPMDAYRRR